MANDYTIQGREIFSAKGKLVARLNDDGQPVMEPGMQGPHTVGVREFVQSLKLGDAASCRVKSTPLEAASPKSKVESPKSDLPDEEATAEESSEVVPAVVKENLTTQSQEDWEISTIPEDMLPPFSAALGVNTPGFQEYVKKHKLTMPQVAALVKRLSE